VNPRTTIAAMSDQEPATPMRKVSTLNALFDAASQGLSDPSVSDGPPEEVDIVIAGGGIKGYYVAGAHAVLLQNKNRLRAVRYAGASAGAWAAMMMCCETSPELWAETYRWTGEYATNGKKILDGYREIFDKVFPEDAWKRCSGRVFISITRVTPLGLENFVVSTFTCNEDLFSAACASAHIPFFSKQKLHTFRDERLVIDGSLTDNLPVFRDGARRQMLFLLKNVPYGPIQVFPFNFLPSLVIDDTCIEALSMRGAMEMRRFLKGEEVKAVVWHKSGLGDHSIFHAKLVLGGLLLAAAMFRHRSAFGRFLRGVGGGGVSADDKRRRGARALALSLLMGRIPLRRKRETREGN